MRREKSEAVGTVFEMNVEGKRGERKSRKKGLDAIDSDMRIVGVCVSYGDLGHEWPTPNF